MDIDAAWENQSASLKEVQIKGGNLEKYVKEILDWDSGRVVYNTDFNYDLQVDSVFPKKDKPEIIISVTYTEPDTKGHSNENKLQLKVGELAIFKNKYPDCKVVLVIGGSVESWLNYVLAAFNFFFDEVIFLWEDEGIRRLYEIKDYPESVELKHKNFWKTLRDEWNQRALVPKKWNPPVGLLRYKIVDKIKSQKPAVHHPDLVNSRIAGLCLHRSKRKGGKEWDNFIARNWNSIEQSRNYFNPMESLVELILSDAGLFFEGGIAQDVPVKSFLHDLGMTNTLLSEDFVLFSKKYNCDVYIQCKASGGGRLQHGKNIQNRAKEQITRGILYRCSLENNNIVLNNKNFIWISILDGDWGVTKKTPLKYIHMLQIAGYDHFFGSETLIDSNLEPLSTDQNPLSKFLIEELECSFKSEIKESISLR